MTKGVSNLKKRFLLGLGALALVGCSDPEPQVVDVDEAAANAGLASDEYETHENGAIKIKSKATSNLTVDSAILAFKDAGIPIGEVVIQTAETDPNNRLGRPGEYTGSAQFEDKRVEQLEPIPELDLDEPDLPLGGTIEVFNNEKDLQARKQYIEQVYEMMPTAKEYMYVSGLVLLRLQYELTPTQAQEYEAVLNSL